MEYVSIFLILVLLLIGAGFSSGYETGLISIPVPTLEVERKSKRGSTIWLVRKIENLEKLVSVTLVATNLFLVGAIIILLTTLTKRFEEPHAELLTIVLLIPVSIVFSEILPKSLFRSNPELIFKMAKLFQLIYYTMYPVAYLFYFLPSKFINYFTHVPIRLRTIISKEQIKIAIMKSEEKGLLKDSEISILYRVLDLGKKQVKEIMIPMKKIAFLNKDLNTSQAFEEFKKYEFSRLPVFDQEKEEFTGLINYMDFLITEPKEEVKITDIMHPITYVDDNTYLDDLLVKMLRNKTQLVGIKNTINVTVGIVTLEDVLEEIVGEY